MASVTVVVVVICGNSHTRKCLKALAAQQDAPAFETIVAHSTALPGIHGAVRGFSRTRLVSEKDKHTPIDLAALGIKAAQGEVVLLTEDHCVPNPLWIRSLLDAMSPGRAAIGGPIEPLPGLSRLGWAFCFVDFFPYIKPLAEGTTAAVSSCNVAYRREDLLAVQSNWQHGLHETALHETLKRNRGPLWMAPKAWVHMGRNVTLRPAMRERCDLGWLYAARRLPFLSKGTAWLYRLTAWALPLMLLARYARKVARRADSTRRFLASLPVLLALVLAWSWGEWMGYLTGRAPKKVRFAPEAGNTDISV